MKQRRKRRGFTLLELVVVIAILALLLAVAIPAYTGYREKAEIQAQKANVRMLENAAMMYFSEGNTDEIHWVKDTETTIKYVKNWPPGCTVEGGPNNLKVTCGEISNTDDTSNGE